MIRKTLVSLILLSSLQLSAQSSNRQWLTISYEAFESKQSSLDFSQRLRWQDQEFDQWISELDYKTVLSNQFSAGIEFRYILENDRAGAIQGNRSAGRVRFNLYHEIDIKGFDLENRAGIQYKRRFDDQKEDLAIRFRPKITPKIKNFKHDPNLRVEWIQNLSNSKDYSIRYGIDFPFKFDMNQLKIGYFMESANLGGQQHVLFLAFKFGR